VADDAMGFCFANNVAVAAQALIDDGVVERVAIFDWDVHHGNGTQDIFYERRDVFYASFHENGLYPGTGEVAETGEGAAEGTNLNLPLAAGAFDAHRHDPISRMRVSTEGYAVLTDQVRDIADGVGAGLAFVLEGGYGLDTLSDGVAIVHETFDGRRPMEPDEGPNEKTELLVSDVRDALGL
jgi:acetoin utilization deacetylase AcuC-like enzyme